MSKKKINPFPYQSPEYHRWHYQNNKEKRYESRKRWALKNPEKEYERKNRQNIKRKMFRVPCWYGEEDKEVFKRLARVRDFLTDATGYAWHIDHIIPLQGREVSGLHCKENWQLLPGIENQKKSNTLIIE